MTSEEQLHETKALLEIERKEDLRQYREKVLRRSLSDRVEKGISWYPVHLKGIFIGTGEKIVLELEREARGKSSNALQAGSTISVFGMNADNESGRNSGVIAWIRKNTMQIVLGTEQIPEWVHGSKIGVDLDFDDTTYREMNKALGKVREASTGERIYALRELILGTVKPSFHKWEVRYQNPSLNDSQNVGVELALRALDFAIIHGPPGTGKTTTLVQAIKETLRRENQVLVCAPSNTAVDLLVLKCQEQGLSVVRLGNPARVDEELHKLTLDGAIAGHDDYKLLKKYRKEAEDLKKRALKFKRKYGNRERQQRNVLMKEVRELKQTAHRLEDYIIHQILSQRQVVASTLTGAAHSVLGNKRFYSVFIDEAAQALSPATWIPLLRADRVIFAGDHHQLPPTVKSPEAEKGGLGKTLFEQAILKSPESTAMLQMQYRMHHQIMDFSGRWFYKGLLQAALFVKYRTLGEDFPAVEFVDTAGCGFEEKKDPETLSTFNTEEAHMLLKHVALLFNQMESKLADTWQLDFSLGIIAPYKAQVKALAEQVAESPLLGSYVSYISVNTVDGFQGQERDVIYISLTRSNSKGEIGFLGNVRRMNVAMTRARKKLVVVGDSSTLGQHPFFQAFFDYIDEIGAYHTAWEWADV
ncbi:MAG: AAA domain-containing protein [Bacteroidota bacterium]